MRLLYALVAAAVATVAAPAAIATAEDAAARVKDGRVIVLKPLQADHYAAMSMSEVRDSIASAAGTAVAAAVEAAGRARDSPPVYSSAIDGPASRRGAPDALYPILYVLAADATDPFVAAHAAQVAAAAGANFVQATAAHYARSPATAGAEFRDAALRASGAAGGLEADEALAVARTAPLGWTDVLDLNESLVDAAALDAGSASLSDGPTGGRSAARRKLRAALRRANMEAAFDGVVGAAPLGESPSQLPIVVVQPVADVCAFIAAARARATSTSFRGRKVGRTAVRFPGAPMFDMDSHSASDVMLLDVTARSGAVWYGTFRARERQQQQQALQHELALYSYAGDAVGAAIATFAQGLATAVGAVDALQMSVAGSALGTAAAAAGTWSSSADDGDAPTPIQRAIWLQQRDSANLDLIPRASQLRYVGPDVLLLRAEKPEELAVLTAAYTSTPLMHPPHLVDRALLRRVHGQGTLSAELKAEADAVDPARGALREVQKAFLPVTLPPRVVFVINRATLLSQLPTASGQSAGLTSPLLALLSEGRALFVLYEPNGEAEAKKAEEERNSGPRIADAAPEYARAYEVFVTDPDERQALGRSTARLDYAVRRLRTRRFHQVAHAFEAETGAAARTEAHTIERFVVEPELILLNDALAENDATDLYLHQSIMGAGRWANFTLPKVTLTQGAAAADDDAFTSADPGRCAIAATAATAFEARDATRPAVWGLAHGPMPPPNARLASTLLQSQYMAARGGATYEGLDEPAIGPGGFGMTGPSASLEALAGAGASAWPFAPVPTRAVQWVRLHANVAVPQRISFPDQFETFTGSHRFVAVLVHASAGARDQWYAAAEAARRHVTASNEGAHFASQSGGLVAMAQPRFMAEAEAVGDDTFTSTRMRRPPHALLPLVHLNAILHTSWAKQVDLMRHVPALAVIDSREERVWVDRRAAVHNAARIRREAIEAGATPAEADAKAQVEHEPLVRTEQGVEQALVDTLCDIGSGSLGWLPTDELGKSVASIIAADPTGILRAARHKLSLSTHGFVVIAMLTLLGGTILIVAVTAFIVMRLPLQNVRPLVEGTPAERAAVQARITQRVHSRLAGGAKRKTE